GLSSWSAHGAAIGWNVREDISKYEGLVSRGKVPIVSGIERTADDEMRRHITMPLKCWGKVMKKVYEERTGIPFDGVFKSKREALVKHGLIVEDGEKMTLTPRGRFVADEVCQFFYHPDHAPFKKEAYADGELNLYADIAA
ncbi:MAG: hypothetical protein PHW14_06275, partial [Candidatus Omnitrophica bacterium]|nr:hypothetical protein [Candidatus Omnitrophota bacterium]